MVLLTWALFRWVEERVAHLPPSRTLAAADVTPLDRLPPRLVDPARSPSTAIAPDFAGPLLRLHAGRTWLRLDLPAGAGAPPSILELERPDLLVATLLIVQPDGQVETQRIHAHDAPGQRALPSRRPALSLPRGEHVVYLGLEAPFPGGVRLVLWEDARGFYTGLRLHDSVIALYLGILGILLLLNLFVFATTRDRIYRDYAFFLFFHGFSTLVYEGFYLGTPLARIPAIHQILMASIPLSLFWVLRFSDRFLGLGQEGTTAGHRVLQVLSFASLVLLLQLLFLGLPRVWGVFILLQSATVLFTAIGLLGVAAARARSGRTAHLIFLLAFIPHVLAVSRFLSGSLGLLPHDPTFYYKLLISSILEMVLIGLALAVAVQRAQSRQKEADRRALEAAEKARAIEAGFRAELESQVAARTAELAQADRQKSHLLSILAHDLRSPLNSLVQIAEFSLRPRFRSSGQDPYEVLGSVGKTGRALYALLDNLLAWARLNWEGRQPSPEVFNLRQALDPALDLVREEAAAKAISLDGLEAWTVAVRADRAMVRTLVRNLLANAVRQTPPGGQIRFLAEANGPSLRLALANSGPAIPANVIERLSSAVGDPEHESAPGSDTSTMATGLGLLLCREVVENHGGHLELGWLEGVGPRVRFELPLPPIDAGALPSPPVS